MAALAGRVERTAALSVSAHYTRNQFDPSLTTRAACHCAERLFVAAPSMLPAALAIVTALAELSTFLMAYWRPEMPLGEGSVKVNVAEVASARRTESVAVRVLD